MRLITEPFFRSRAGTKVDDTAAEALVPLEVDGYGAPSSNAWSVVMKGRAEDIHQIAGLTDTVDLPLCPWQSGEKTRFIRVVPVLITGRRFSGGRARYLGDAAVGREAFSGEIIPAS